MRQKNSQNMGKSGTLPAYFTVFIVTDNVITKHT